MCSNVNLVRQCRKLVCVGRNFADHALELRNDISSTPVLFLKPSSALITQPSSIIIPSSVNALHHEVELGLVIGKRVSHVSVAEADSAIKGYVLALDMTARQLQDEAKQQRLPWSVSKGFDTFAPISSFIPKHAINDPNNVTLWCKVNGQIRQHDNTNKMLFNCHSLIAYISQIFTLEENDIILTGTPKGVGPVQHGDVIEAGIEGIQQSEVKFRVEKSKHRPLTVENSKASKL